MIRVRNPNSNINICHFFRFQARIYWSGRFGNVSKMFSGHNLRESGRPSWAFPRGSKSRKISDPNSLPNMNLLSPQSRISHRGSGGFHRSHSVFRKRSNAMEVNSQNLTRFDTILHLTLWFG